MSVTFGKQYEMVPCPFCRDGKVSCIYFPSATSVRRNLTASLPGKGALTRTKESWVVQSGCEKCGKSRDDVERKLHEDGII